MIKVSHGNGIEQYKESPIPSSIPKRHRAKHLASTEQGREAYRLVTVFPPCKGIPMDDNDYTLIGI